MLSRVYLSLGISLLSAS